MSSHKWKFSKTTTSFQRLCTSGENSTQVSKKQRRLLRRYNSNNTLNSPKKILNICWWNLIDKQSLWIFTSKLSQSQSHASISHQQTSQIQLKIYKRGSTFLSNHSSPASILLSIKHKDKYLKGFTSFRYFSIELIATLGARYSKRNNRIHHLEKWLTKHILGSYPIQENSLPSALKSASTSCCLQ